MNLTSEKSLMKFIEFAIFYRSNKWTVQLHFAMIFVINNGYNALKESSIRYLDNISIDIPTIFIII